MVMWLKQSTSTDVGVGPFVDSTDGVTAETALTITQPDIRLKKNGGNWAQKNAAQTLSHEENGWYEVTLDATDTDTLGRLQLAVHESGALPVFMAFMVVPANVWDSMFGADKLEVDVTQFGGSNATATGGRPEVNTTHAAGTAWNSGAIGASTLAADTITAAKIAGDAITAAKIADGAIDAGAIAADAITAAKIADGAIDAATFAAGAINAAAIAADAITAAKVAADVSAEIADAVWDEDATGHQTGGTFGQAIGDPGADTTTIYQAVVTDAAGATIAADIIDIEGKVDDLESRLGTPSNLGSGATVAANLVDIEAQTDDIGSAGAGLTAVPWNAAWDAEVQSEVQDAIEVNHLDHLLAVTYDPASKPGAADALLNELVESDAGVARFTANALEEAPSGGGGGPSAADIADAVWDEATAGHTTSGTFGEQLKTDVDAILVDTAEIGAAGAGLSAIPWNASWDAEVQSEVADALGVYDPPTNAEMEARTLAAASYATAAALDTVDNFLDTEIAAIKAKTDSLTFTVSGKVDANITYVNEIEVTGSGTSGDPWGPV